jgi:hypothetical protein
LKVFVTGDDVDLEGVDDPNDTSHSMFVGTFSVLFGGSMPKNDFILWFVSIFNIFLLFLTDLAAR